MAVLLFVSNATSIFIQTIGWTYMIANFAQQGSVKDAIVKTFEGKSPCTFCKLSKALVVTSSSKETAALAPSPEPDLSSYVGNALMALRVVMDPSGGVASSALLASVAGPARPEARPG